MDFLNNAIGKMLKSSFSIKDKIQKVKENLKNIFVEGESGAGLIKVKASARLEIVDINIEESDDFTKEELNTLLKAAINDALRKAEKKAMEEFKKASEEMSLPFDVSEFLK
jgi:nucleoid-associated protein EbfC